MSSFVHHTVYSPPTHNLRPEDGPVQGPKLVVYLIIKLHHFISCVLMLLPLPSKLFSHLLKWFRRPYISEFTVGIFIDLTKAYDVLNHKLLLAKLYSCGIRGTTYSWFRSYLTNRRQFVEINQSDSSNVMVNRYRSSFLEIKQGVPQGWVLGLLLFLLYINDGPLNIHSANLVMFADDINVLITDSDVGALQIKIDRVIAELETWFNRSDLIINVSNTGVMSFYNRQTSFLVKPKVAFNKMNLDYIIEMKFLGIYITETLKWNSHVQSLARKLSKVSFMIKSLEILSPSMIQNIYFTKFPSLLRFGILFWGDWGVN